MTATCSVTFSDGVPCTRAAQTRGLCGACYSWSAKNFWLDPNGRDAVVRVSGTCSTVFLDGSLCVRARKRNGFGGMCGPCSNWSHKNGGVDPSGRDSRTKRERGSDSFQSSMHAVGAIVMGPYIDANTKVHVQCVKGHDCYPYPSNISSGYGVCVSCSGRATNVYYVVRGNGLVKPGVTSGIPDVRLKAHARERGLTERLLVLTGLPPGDARWAELEVLSVLYGLGAEPVEGTREYFDDAWTDTVLDTVGWFL